MRISVRVTNTDTVIRNLNNKETEAIKQAQEVISQAVQTVLTETQAVMPVVTGALKNSGKTAVQEEGQNIIGYVGFGDSSTNPTTGKTTASYAVEKHEDPINGKWLENTVQNYAEIFVADLTTALSKIF